MAEFVIASPPSARIRRLRKNMLGRKQPIDAVLFVWGQHYNTVISHVGHVEQWDRLGVEGDRSAGDCAMSFRHNGRKLALATIGRDLDSLRAELAFEQEPVA